MTHEEARSRAVRELIDRSNGEQILEGVAAMLVAAQPWVTGYLSHGLTKEQVITGIKEAGNAGIAALAKSHGIAPDKA